MSNSGLLITDVLNKFKHTYTGHYHHRTNRTYQDDKTITYIGSPYQITRIDKNCERGYGILNLENNDFHWENNTQSMKFNIFTYPNIDKTKITGQVVDIHVPYEYQSETKKIYDLVRELDALHPAYPVNTFNDPRPETDENDVSINTENFNLLSLFPKYLEQIKNELPSTLTVDELNKELVSLYNTFKGVES